MQNGAYLISLSVHRERDESFPLPPVCRDWAWKEYLSKKTGNRFHRERNRLFTIHLLFLLYCLDFVFKHQVYTTSSKNKYNFDLYMNIFTLLNFYYQTSFIQHMEPQFVHLFLPRQFGRPHLPHSHRNWLLQMQQAQHSGACASHFLAQRY